MSLEEALAANTAAILALTKAIATASAPRAGLGPFTPNQAAPQDEPAGAPVAEEVKPAQDPKPAKAVKSKAEPKPKPEPKPEIQYDVVSAAITALIGAGRRDKAVDILSAFGVSNGKGLKPEQYPDALAKFQAALAA